MGMHADQTNVPPKRRFRQLCPSVPNEAPHTLLTKTGSTGTEYQRRA